MSPPPFRFSRSTAAGLCVLWLAALLAPLASAGRVLANRDILLFHLPLRHSFAHFVANGFPSWSSWLHGGQPLLENPNYSAFYPPTWLALVVPPNLALGLEGIFHIGLLFAGAWFLARRLGAESSAAAFAALAASGGGAALSLFSAFNLLCGIAWFPWVLAAVDATVRASAKSGAGDVPRLWQRPVLGGALATGLLLLNGEPATILLSALGAIAMALAAIAAPSETPFDRRRALTTVGRLVLSAALGLALAAVQIVPAFHLLADSPRAGGLEQGSANAWSMPPARFLELAAPRLFGDPALEESGLFFSWGIHDRNYPYVVALYPGLAVTVLGFAGLFSPRKLPRRGAWLALTILGFTFALGRFLPGYEAIRHSVPILALLRYPEKFAILALLALAFAAALTWQRLLAQARAGDRHAATVPFAIAAGVALIAAATWITLQVRPEIALDFVRAHGIPHTNAKSLAVAARYFTFQMGGTAVIAAALAGLLSLFRRERPPLAKLAILGPAFLAADLWIYGHGLIRTIPAHDIANPPALAEPFAGSHGRVWSEFEWGKGENLLPRTSEDQRLQRTLVRRLDPYSGAIWGLPYVLNKDFDLTLTPWARHARRVMLSEWNQGSRLTQFLGTWSASALLLRIPMEEQKNRPAAELALLPANLVRNQYALPIFRWMPEVEFHATIEQAVATASAAGWASSPRDHWLDESLAPSSPAKIPSKIQRCAHRPQLTDLEDLGGKVSFRYQALDPPFFVAGLTFHENWRVAVDGKPWRAHPTAAGQIGLALPSGEHTVELRYPTRGLGAGKAATLLAMLALAALGLVDVRSRARRRPANGVESSAS